MSRTNVKYLDKKARPAGLDGLITLRYDQGARVAGLIKKSGLTGRMADWLLARFPASGE